MAEKMGAVAIDPIGEDVQEKIKKIVGKGADAAVIAAGAGNIVDQACVSVRKRGEICIVAMITERIPVYTYGVVFNEQRVFGAMTYSSSHFKDAADMVNSGLDLRCLVTHSLDIEHTQEALNILSEKKEDVVKVLIEFAH
jgi:L-iditol 2-dehydrogenase